MPVSQKCQYALRAIYELAQRRQGEDQGATTAIAEIATAQAIPIRFLEVILNQLKQDGYVESRRGVQGGYRLAVSPETLAVGDVIRSIDGPIEPIRGPRVAAGNGKAGQGDESLDGQLAFQKLWQEVHDAIAQVYDSTSFTDLIERQRAATSVAAGSNYSI